MLLTHLTLLSFVFCMHFVAHNALRWPIDHCCTNQSELKLPLRLPAASTTTGVLNELRWPADISAPLRTVRPFPGVFQRPSVRSCIDLTKLTGPKTFSRSASMDSMLSYHTPNSGRTPEMAEGGDALEKFIADNHLLPNNW